MAGELIEDQIGCNENRGLWTVDHKERKIMQKGIM
jgi:hypothetical protein